MANDLTGRPWILDTASATPVQNVGATVKGVGSQFLSNVPGKGVIEVHRCVTTGFVFRNYTGGAASQAIIRDNVRGVDICVLTGNASGTPVGEGWLWPQTILNLTLRQIDSGQVEVILR